MTTTKSGLTEKITPILVIVSILLAFAVGVLWQKVSFFEEGGIKTPTANPVADPAAQPQAPTNGKMTEAQAANIPAVSNSDHVRGASDPEVYLIEYSDYECPFCGQFHPTTLQVLDEYPDQVAVVYRHFPLRQIHPQAEPAAQASECVAKIGGEEAFWKFTDYLFENQDTALADFAKSANAVGVNGSAVETCISSEEMAGKVEEQYQGGISSGVTGTPGNIIMNKNGEAWIIPGAVPFSSIKTTIDEALQS